MVSIELKRRIRWADADAAGRLHFPRIFEYFEEAEAELMRSIGYPLMMHPNEYDFPRVHTECRFRKMLLLDAPFTMRISVGKLGRTSIRYDIQVFEGDAPGDLALEGTMTVVVVQKGRPVEIPPQFRAALSQGG